MSVAPQPLTWDDIKDWPEDSASRIELVHGQIVRSPSPNADHAWISSDLFLELGNSVKEHSLGMVFHAPVDVILAPDVVYVPDICFVRQERLEIVQDRIYGPPDLCIEIISESNRTHDTVVKYSDYAKYGVDEYWLVDPREQEISTWRRADGLFELIDRAGRGDRVASKVLDGFDLDPASVLRSTA